jgi:hypothetical protein
VRSAASAKRSAGSAKAQRWRIGCEGRISVLKRRHGLRRCLYKGDAGLQRRVGLGVIADNLIHIGKVLAARPTPKKSASDAQLFPWIANIPYIWFLNPRRREQRGDGPRMLPGSINLKTAVDGR